MKTSKSYYFCQLVGSLLFFSFISLSGISVKKEDIDVTHEIILFIKNLTICILATHFILRAYIKKHLPNSHSSLKIYSIAILFAALSAAIVSAVYGVAFGDSEKSYFSVDYLLSNTLINLVLFTLWSIFYLALTSIVERIKLRQQLRDQELASLMNQINPHFLFNSLNTIRGMIYEDKDKSAELVTKLSTLFRYNLSTDTKAHTSLGAELGVCQHYLDIEDIRLGERLKVNITVSPESKTAKIPTMGLLTLIENAIKHGIEKQKGSGIINIIGKVNNQNMLSVVVKDNAGLMTSDQYGTGISNLLARMKVTYGNDANFSLNCQPSSETIATMEVPCND